MSIRVPRPVGATVITPPPNQKIIIKPVMLVLYSVLVLFSAFAIFFGAQFMGALLVSIVATLLGYSGGSISAAIDSNDLVRFILILVIESFTVWLVYITLKSSKLSLKSIGLTKRPTLRHLFEAVKGYAIYFVTFLSVFSTIGYLRLIDTNQTQQLGFSNPTGANLLFAFMSLVILPPIAEEILFRGYLYQRLKLYAPKLSAIVTSLLFATAHLELGSGNAPNWSAAIDTFILSFVLIYVTNKTKSLYPAIFLHAIKNSIAFVSLFVLK